MSSIHPARGRRRLRARLATLAFGAAVALLPLGASAHEFKVGTIEIGHPWSRATPAGATTGAGYLTLKNDGSTDDRLVSASSPAARDVQIHEMKVENGVMSMRQIEGGVAVPAGSQVQLSSGGTHLMLVGLKKPFSQGDKVPLTLRFEKAGSVDVWLAVDKLGASGEDAHDHMQMDGMKMDGSASQ